MSTSRAVGTGSGGIGSGVNSLQGSIVDNSDPSNPIVNINKKLGWWVVTDTTKTIGAPLSIPSNTRTKLNLNADSVIEAFAPDGIPASSIYDNVSKKITPLVSGDSYLLRVSLIAVPSQNNNSITIDLDIGGTQGIILERSQRLQRGSGVPNPVSTTNALFALNTFIANGGDLYVTCDGNVDIYGVNIFLQRVTAG